MFGFFKRKKKVDPAAVPSGGEPAPDVAQDAPAEEAPGASDGVHMDVPLAGARVAVFGAGKSGLSAATWLVREGARVTVADESAGQLPDDLARDAALVGDNLPEVLSGSDLVILSPGVPHSHPAVAAAEAAGVPVIAEVELAARHLSAPLIGITGTNGKSTVTAMAGHILERWKERVFTGGNLGDPLCDAAMEDGWDFVVAELSSFQLEGITSLQPTIAALLNTSPDHMDRYDKVSDYYAAKFRIFENMTEGYALLNARDASTPLVLEHYLRGAAPVRFNLPDGDGGDGVGVVDGVISVTTGGNTHPIVAVSDLSLTGAQNVENVQAAAAICLLAGCPLPIVSEAAKTFRGLPHRMQVVGDVDGVTYIDDSKATNPGAVIKALEGIDAPVTLLLGGRDKGGDLFSLREHVFMKAEHVVLFGEAANRFQVVLQGHPDLSDAETLEQAVRVAKEKTQAGGVVLLSPACASFDAFSSYAERGHAFATYVESL